MQPKLTATILCTAILFAGCASKPTYQIEKSEQTKCQKLDTPIANNIKYIVGKGARDVGIEYAKEAKEKGIVSDKGVGTLEVEIDGKKCWIGSEDRALSVGILALGFVGNLIGIQNDTGGLMGSVGEKIYCAFSAKATIIGKADENEKYAEVEAEVWVKHHFNDKKEAEALMVQTIATALLCKTVEAYNKGNFIQSPQKGTKLVKP